MSLTVFGAFLTAVRDLRNKEEQHQPVPENVRLDGKVCLITGASKGLGKAIATDLARRGCHLILACRSGIPEVGNELQSLTGNTSIEMIEVDLADLSSVHRLCDQLKARKVRLDILVLNAGTMPRRAVRTPQGFESMFAVHFLANRILIDRFLKDQVVVPNNTSGVRPRIVFVSSETHRVVAPIDFNHFGEFKEYGISDTLEIYGQSKLILTTFAMELSRRLNLDGNTNVCVHSLCPGPISTNFTRDAPIWFRPLIDLVLKVLFPTAAKAAEAVVFLCCDPISGEDSGRYMHMFMDKKASPLATSMNNGSAVWELSQGWLDVNNLE